MCVSVFFSLMLPVFLRCAQSFIIHSGLRMGNGLGGWEFCVYSRSLSNDLASLWNYSQAGTSGRLPSGHGSCWPGSHQRLHVSSSEKRPPARVQLQQPGNQPEEMSGVGKKWGRLSIFLDCVFISSLRFSFIFYKSIRSEVWYFQFPLTQICCLHKSLFPLKRSSCLRDSLIYFFSCVLVNTL